MHEASAVLVRVGRYTLHGAVASGGMATVHLGRMASAAGVSRTVAIKRVHRQFSDDPDFVSMFFDEARLSLRIQHPNVVPTFDVVAESGELLLVMDYVHGDSLASLLREAARLGERAPPAVVGAIVGDVLAGLQAAHDLRGEDGAPLGIVHRDVSPQNVLVGVDGAARVLDFGVAKAAGRVHSTEQGKVKGKIAYMAPEQLLGAAPVDRRADIFSASVVLWEALTGGRLFEADGPGAVALAVMSGAIPTPSSVNPALGPDVDQVVMTGLARHVDARYASAEAMAIALERALPPAPSRVVGEWVARVGRDRLEQRSRWLAEVERGGAVGARASGDEREAVASGVDVQPSEILPRGGAVEAMPTLVSTTVTTGPELASRWWRWPAFGAAGIAVVGAVAVLARRPGDAPASAPPVAVAAPASAVNAPDAPVASAPQAAVAARSEPAPPPSASHSAGGARSRPPSARPRAPAPDCANPFVVDSKGIRVPRPECF